MNKNVKSTKNLDQAGLRPAAKKPASNKGAAAIASAPAAPAPILRKNQVVLELVRPGAQQVSVAGSFNSWEPQATPLKPVAPDRWSGSLELTPGRHEYLFVVDGQWLPDPNAPEAVQNPFGGRNSVLVVKE